MTCTIGIKTVGGHCLLAADTCVSWKINGKYYFQDDLQKIYGLTPDVAVAISSGNLIIARELLQSSRDKIFQNYTKLLTKGRIWPIGNSIRRIFARNWIQADKGNTGLLIGVSYKCTGRLFWWHSSHPRSATEEVKNVGLKILGSINNDDNLSALLEKQVWDVVNLRERGAPLDPLNAANILGVILTDFFASDVGRKVNVGGLFQVMFHNGEEFVPIVSDITSLKSEKYGTSYDVSLIEDHTGEFVQANHNSGAAFSLRSLDDQVDSIRKCTTWRKHTFIFAKQEVYLLGSAQGQGSTFTGRLGANSGSPTKVGGAPTSL